MLSVEKEFKSHVNYLPKIQKNETDVTNNVDMWAVVHKRAPSTKAAGA